jgi:hypothetical protein
MAHDVFVSYSSKDKTVADAIVAALENNHIRCWYAPRDIKSGEDWGKAITTAIEASRVFLVVFSAHANRSQRVLDEVNLAISQRAAIIPFRIEDLEPDGAMKLHLSSRHWLDAYEPSWQSHLKKLVNNVSANLSEEIKESEVDLPASVHKAKGKGVGVIAGIAGAAAVLAAAWYFLPPAGFAMPSMLAGKATPTAMLAPVATQTEVPATSTIVPTAALPDSVAELGEPDYETDFGGIGNPGHYWPIGEKDADGFVEIDSVSDGNARMIVKDYNAAMDKGNKKYINSIMEVDAKFGAGNANFAGEEIIEIYCRDGREKNFGVVVGRIYSNGRVEVVHDMAVTKVIIESNRIGDFDPEQTYRLRLDCIGNSFQFLVNGSTYVSGDLEFASFSGYIGLSSQYTVVKFDNFKLWIR